MTTTQYQINSANQEVQLHKKLNNPKRIVVLISGSGTNMKAIMNHCLSTRSEDSNSRNSDLDTSNASTSDFDTFTLKPSSEQTTPIINADVCAVISNRKDAGGLAFAEEFNIPTHVLLSANYADRETYDRALADTIAEYAPDLIVLAGFMRLLSAEFVQRFSGKLINIHPSLLPKFPGLDTHQRAIDAGEVEHGTSVHFVDEGLDSGPVILQAKVPIFEDDTVDLLTERVKYQEHQIYPLVIKWFTDGRLTLTNNQAFLDGKPLGETGYAAE